MKGTGLGEIWEGLIEGLPFVDFPSEDEPFEFYKVQKWEEGQMWVVLGLKLHRMRHYEEDHLLYLNQILIKECPRLKVTFHNEV